MNVDEACNLTAHPCPRDHDCTVGICMPVCGHSAGVSLSMAILQGYPVDHRLLSGCQRLLASTDEALGGRCFTCKCFRTCICVSVMGCKPHHVLPLAMFACLRVTALKVLQGAVSCSLKGCSCINLLVSGLAHTQGACWVFPGSTHAAPTALFSLRLEGRPEYLVSE